MLQLSPAREHANMRETKIVQRRKTSAAAQAEARIVDEAARQYVRAEMSV